MCIVLDIPTDLRQNFAFEISKRNGATISLWNRNRYEISKSWHHILYDLIDMPIGNSYLRKSINEEGRADQLSFKINLARQLIKGFAYRKRWNKPILFLWNKHAVPNEVGLSDYDKICNPMSNFSSFSKNFNLNIIYKLSCFRLY